LRDLKTYRSEFNETHLKEIAEKRGLDLNKAINASNLQGTGEFDFSKILKYKEGLIRES